MDRGGFFKVHRKIFESDLWPNKNASRLFLYLLGHSAWEPLKTDARYQSVTLQPGDVLTGLHRLAADCALTVREVRNAIVCLKRANRITVRATNRFSIISVVNWDLYQNVSDQKGKQDLIGGGKQKGKQTTSRGQAEGNIEEVKELKKKGISDRYEYPADFMEFWSAYPRRENKSQARKEWETEKKHNPEFSLPRLILAAKTYAGEVSGREKEHIKMPSTFLHAGTWMEKVPADLDSRRECVAS